MTPSDTSTSPLRLLGKALRTQGTPTLARLVIVLVCCCLLLTLVNIAAIKILSTFRAYINGESQYSKAQKDGSRHLLEYLNGFQEVDWKSYQQAIDVNRGDIAALKAVLKGMPAGIIQDGFTRGRNNPDDQDDMVLMIRYGGSLPFFQPCIQYWEAADDMILAIDQRVSRAHKRILAGTYSPADAKLDSQAINQEDNQITILETKFSDKLSSTSRLARYDLYLFNGILICIVIGAVGLFSATTILRLFNDKRAVQKRNLSLIESNLEMDRFVYSASHDLRAPITSLMGLLQLIKEETNITLIREYLGIMEECLSQQDDFIHEIINYSKNKQTGLVLEKVNLRSLVEAAVTQHQYLADGSSISFTTDLKVEEIYCDAFRLRIILNNLISNAIKFRDDSKPFQIIDVRCTYQDPWFKLDVEDNGVGIPENLKERIFDMFFYTKNSTKSSGLGLYITTETIGKLGGKISVESRVGHGSCFSVFIPLVMKPEKGPLSEEIERFTL